MKKSTKYKIFMWMDALVIILWPIAAITSTLYPVWMVFLMGAVWCSDIFNFFSHWRGLKEAKAEEEE